MEEQEVPTEGLTERINEAVEKAEAASEKQWSFFVAISTALIAVLAAISSLLAGHHSNEALIEQIKTSDQWAFYQAKVIRSEIASLNSNAHYRDSLEEKYKAQQQDIKKEAEKHQADSDEHLQRHILLSKAVTLFQIAIAIAAISIISRKKFLWYISLLLAMGGIFFFISGLL